MATKGKSNNKNLKALFSVICLCIIAMGLIVYFSTQSAKVTDVNENTKVKVSQTTAAPTTEKATEVQRRVTVKDTTAAKKQSTTAKKEKTTENATMQQSDTNIPYKSFYKYPAGETALNGYTQELVLNETMGDYRSHTAVDFKCSAGEKISAINDGLVLNVTKSEMYGNIVEIDHGGNLVARYCGLETVNVAKGSYVTIGQSIGTLGIVPFEAKSEYHLHFETLINNEYVNPLDVMGKSE